MSLAPSPVRSAGAARLLALLLAFTGVLFVGVTATDTADAAPVKKPSITVPVTGTTADGTPITGTYKIKRFKEKNGDLIAKGTFTGTLGGADDQVKKAVRIPVSGATTPAAAKVAAPAQAAAQATTCQVLDLVLGPLDLNLLGLKVHLDTVHLNITADQGPGNLLGNLLCAVAGLLNGPSTPTLNNIVAQLLNYILGIIG